LNYGVSLITLRAPRGANDHLMTPRAWRGANYYYWHGHCTIYRLTGL